MRIKIFKLFGHKTNTGGIVSFQNSLEEFQLKSNYKYYHFRTGAISNNKLMSIWIIRIIDLVVSYLIYPVYLMILKPDIIEINSSFYSKSFNRDKVYAWLSKVFSSRSKRILFNHGWGEQFEEHLKKSQPNAVRNYFNLFSKIIVLTHPIKNKLINHGIDKKNIFITSTGVITTNYKVSVNESPNFNILFLSRVEKAKGINELIDSIPFVVRRYGNVIFHIAGSGSYLETIKSNKLLKGYMDNVIFHGYIRGENKFRLLSRTDIFVLPSYHEGCPVSVIEALASGIPIVYTPVGALPDILTDQVNGIKVELKSPESIAKAIIYLLDNQGLRESMIKENKRYCKEHFELEEIFNKLEYIYSIMLD